MSYKRIAEKWGAKDFNGALAEIELLLASNKSCPHLWNLRGDAIQLSEDLPGLELKDAELSYKTALELNPNDLETLESLAHFYDAVDDNPKEAKRFAQAYVILAAKSLKEMEKILAEPN